MRYAEAQQKLFAEVPYDYPLPSQAGLYPELRYMGSKNRLLPWIHSVLQSLDFDSAADPFLGSGCVAYLLKSMGKRVIGSDFLNFPTVIAKATIENSKEQINTKVLTRLLSTRTKSPDFIQHKFAGIFFDTEDLKFLDRICGNLERLSNEYQQDIVRAALMRSCLKKQPRGVFTVSGSPSKYDDGRRDMRLSIEAHFIEQIQVFNHIVFDNGAQNRIYHRDVFAVPTDGIDLVYLDPPYVPRSDDNCYVKRYHFLEGLSCYWRGLEIMENTKVKKIAKRYTPFSYRRTAIDAFNRLFDQFRHSIIVLSYSSNGFPNLEEIESIMGQYKRKVVTYKKPHRYHFGTHEHVERALVDEYLIVGC
ncbi:MAG: DNA adenine methylase [Syntrophales bacterium]